MPDDNGPGFNKSGNDDARDASGGGQPHCITTFTYDSLGRCTSVTDGRSRGTLMSLATPQPPPAGKRDAADQALVEHTFEFRLCGTERHEQILPIAVPEPRARCQLRTENVSAYLTRDHGATDQPSAIGGLEVSAKLQRRSIVCTAGLSDFSPTDLVVVRVRVSLWQN